MSFEDKNYKTIFWKNGTQLLCTPDCMQFSTLPGTQFGSGTYREWHNQYVVNADAHRRNRGHLFVWELEDRKACERNEE